MAVTLEAVHQDMQAIKSELYFLRHIVEEDYELSDDTIRKLEKTRRDMKSGKYISHKVFKAKYG